MKPAAPGSSALVVEQHAEEFIVRVGEAAPKGTPCHPDDRIDRTDLNLILARFAALIAECPSRRSPPSLIIRGRRCASRQLNLPVGQGGHI